ncbi:MAG: hypothetical protein CVU41_06885 [Chloroflexi bacterium HGW-Chloroflexi-3]|nr:MAG: hypothetical protein CVU41_06885 [Chloroflexi bacterium HGW-Chloroflexi-3]
MNKKMILIVLVTMLLLTACSGGESVVPVQNQEAAMNEVEMEGADTSGAENPADPDQVQSQDQTQEMVQLSTQVRLILGSMALDDNDLKLTQEQATALIPLWKVMKTLLSSDTAAGEEIEALLNQIQTVLTPEQLEWINNYNLSKDAYQEILTKYVPEEFQITGSLLTEEEREEKRATAIAANGGTVPPELQSGGGGRGMGGGMGGGIPGGGAGTSAGEGTGGGTGQLNTFLIDALVAELELIAIP